MAAMVYDETELQSSLFRRNELKKEQRAREYATVHACLSVYLSVWMGVFAYVNDISVSNPEGS